MRKRLDPGQRSIPVVLSLITLASVLVLSVWDALPGIFPTRAHTVLGALPLALIALAYLAYQTIRRPSVQELIKAILLSIAFLLWAANQFWPDKPYATLLNDMAIWLFVLDVVLVIMGWPAGSPDESFAD
jgi:hypothetical protein